MVGLLHIASISLVVAGGLKLTNPHPTAAALDGAGLPSRIPLVAGLAIGELVLGAAALLVGGALTAGLVSVVYLGFALFIVRALRTSGDDARCGCFGDSNAPPSKVHVAVNLAIAMAAAGLALTEAPSLFEVVSDQPAAGVPYVALTAIGAAAMFLLLDRLPRVQAAVRGVV